MLEEIVKQIPLSLTTQALLIGITVGVVTYYTFGKRKYKLPPGPWAPPLLGNIGAIMSNTPLYKLLLDWRQDYGPVITIYFGPLRCIMLNSGDAVNEAYVKKAAEFAGRYQIWSMASFSDDYRNIVFSDISPAWKYLRKIAHQGLRQYLSGSALEENLFETSSKTMNKFREENGKPINIYKYINLLVFNLLNGVCFNKSFEIDDKLFLELVESLNSVNDDIGKGFLEDIIPPLRKYPTAKFKKIKKNFGVIETFIAEEFAKHQELYSEGNMKDFTDFLIHGKKQAALEDPEINSIVTDRHLIQAVTDIFGAGVDTTRQTITWTILLLVTHPEIQKKVQDELDEVFDAGQPVTVSSREKLPYTEAVLHESMRICPVVPIGLPHKTRCDVTLGDYEIPEGTMVMTNHWALHHDPDVWKDPEVFRPERFLDEDGKLAPKTMSWLPFSAGRRNCLGETIARPEMHLMLALLLRNFTFRCPEGETINLIPVPALTFSPPMNYVVAEERTN
ncbi:cytochrome P450 1A1 [Patella vulgata]|uniref:cytochrome P450 1A1 n=1 Tax=Patella vulgata TaxID=6465 RepID=UPI002180887B|nr:cytochrome P450 1A1 [Patella vulgata]XP_050395925.1 cytochrome P450 1A1 [Patella vulgata]